MVDVVNKRCSHVDHYYWCMAPKQRLAEGGAPMTAAPRSRYKVLSGNNAAELFFEHKKDGMLILSPRQAPTMAAKSTQKFGKEGP